MSTEFSRLRDALNPPVSRRKIAGVFDVRSEPLRETNDGKVSPVYVVYDATGIAIGRVERALMSRWEASARYVSFAAYDFVGGYMREVLRRQTRTAALAALLRYLRGGVVRS